MTELPKPPVLAARGGVWFRAGSSLAVGGSGAPVSWDDNLPGVRRFHTQDPVGNRLEHQQVQA